MSFTLLRFCAAVAVALATVGASHAGHGGPPKSPPPDAARAIIQGDQFYALQSVAVPVHETRTRTVQVNGKAQEEAYMVVRYVTEYRTLQLPREDVRVMTVGGKRLTDEEGAARLATEAEVLVSRTGKLLDPAYQALYPPETLIVYLRTLRHFHNGEGGGVVPPPPPDAPAAPGPVESVPQTVPKFAELPPAKGPPPAIAWLKREGDEPSETWEFVSYGWRAVYEERPVSIEVKDADGNPRTVMKTVAITHWLPLPMAVKLKRAELKFVDRDGEPISGHLSLTRSPDGSTPVPVLSADQQLDPAHFKLFRPDVAVLRADLPAGPQQEFPNQLPPAVTLAKVIGDQLTVFKPVHESRIVKVPVKALENGQEVTKYAEKMEIGTKLAGVQFPLAAVKASDAAGNALDAAALAKRLAKERPVLIWDNNEPVGPIYLPPLKPETLTIVLRASSQPELGEAEEAPPALAAAPESPPSGAPPRFALAQLFGDLLVLRQPAHSTAQFPKTVRKTVDGEVIEKTVYENRVVAHWHEEGVSADNYRLAGIDGKPLDAAAVRERLSQETMVLVSDQGKKVDPAWLAIYNLEAVVVYLRPRMYGGYAAPAPAPVAEPGGPLRVDEAPAGEKPPPPPAEPPASGEQT